MIPLLLALLVSVTPTGPTHSDAPRSTSWRVAVVVYDSVDTVCQGRTIRGSLVKGETDVTEALTELNVAKARIESAGAGRLQFTVIRAGTLTHVSPISETDCYPSPGNLNEMGDWPNGFDSVYVLYDADADDGQHGLNSWGGLHLPCWPCAIGLSTYSTQPIWDGDQDWFDDGGGGFFMHEWGNAVTAFYASHFGREQVPSLYDASDTSRYSWDGDFHHSYMGGNIIDRATGDRVGFERFVWASGTPTSTAASEPKPCKNPNSNAKTCREPST